MAPRCKIKLEALAKCPDGQEQVQVVSLGGDEGQFDRDAAFEKRDAQFTT